MSLPRPGRPLECWMPVQTHVGHAHTASQPGILYHHRQSSRFPSDRLDEFEQRRFFFNCGVRLFQAHSTDLLLEQTRVCRRPRGREEATASVQHHTGLVLNQRGPSSGPGDTASRPQARQKSSFHTCSAAPFALCDGHTSCQPGQATVPSCLASTRLGVAGKVFCRHGLHLQSGDLKKR